jgi:hypothetical protein
MFWFCSRHNERQCGRSQDWGNIMDHIQSYRRNMGLSANLRVLADDLDRINAGAGPTEADLASAPILFDWEPKLTQAQEPAIRGVVRGHPAIPDGETLRAEILALDPDLSWIRTWTGYYRLGCEAEKRAPVLAEQGARA